MLCQINRIIIANCVFSVKHDNVILVHFDLLVRVKVASPAAELLGTTLHKYPKTDQLLVLQQKCTLVHYTNIL